MIVLTRQNGTVFAINDELIEMIEEHPDTTIKLSDGKVYIVSESVEEIINKIVEFRRRCFENVKFDVTKKVKTTDRDWSVN